MLAVSEEAMGITTGEEGGVAAEGIEEEEGEFS